MTDNLLIADLRREYTLAGLRRADLDQDAIKQFQKWFQQALAGKLTEPNAMTLATANKEGFPSARIVLLKGVDERGFTFFTNYESRKGRELTENPNASLVLYWPEMERQVNIAGTVTRVSREESALYFNSRPKGSRLAAWVSAQSEVIENRAALEEKLTSLSSQHAGEEVPLPPFWGGYCLNPSRIEFWQGRPNRLHDRFRYLRQADGQWTIDRLAP
ncbi:pyridoxamine 5'-phosphate oxidase [Pedosphaera parvula]|uniref:Pyridoxamine 5'-phosphate oxidase n=1 Tax=Pedosphaera parvula (strain Ellin514) TaxID=320771 RepID=B9XGG5_PEDPL|nr:pyridoxamine 5'-phosphate oxidase [Pedosphaera parvula]EEF61016.1 pyridoxamine 5'-phosphate oxidase [Pedosphaera parvula Ellin514]